MGLRFTVECSLNALFCVFVVVVWYLCLVWFELFIVGLVDLFLSVTVVVLI